MILNGIWLQVHLKKWTEMTGYAGYPKKQMSEWNNIVMFSKAL